VNPVLSPHRVLADWSLRLFIIGLYGSATTYIMLHKEELGPLWHRLYGYIIYWAVVIAIFYFIAQWFLAFLRRPSFKKAVGSAASKLVQFVFFFTVASVALFARVFIAAIISHSGETTAKVGEAIVSYMETVADIVWKVK
jgi:hypothetical protein